MVATGRGRRSDPGIGNLIADEGMIVAQALERGPFGAQLWHSGAVSEQGSHKLQCQPYRRRLGEDFGRRRKPAAIMGRISNVPPTA